MIRQTLIETNIGNETNELIQAGLKSFNMEQTFLKRNVPYSLNQKLYIQCVLLAMTYASQTCALSKSLKRHLASTQRNMEKGNDQCDQARS